MIHTYPHDPGAFTQGLEYDHGTLLEGTGLNGRSTIRRVKLETGEVIKQFAIPEQHFGEGITLFNGRLFELTWKSQIAFVYDANTFAQKTSYPYSGEGWGLTHDGKNLIMSDGSSALRVLAPEDFHEVSRINVHEGDRPITDLNELEYIKGEIWANIWQTDRIVRISPKTGEVLGWIDLSGILPATERAGADVLNGIAWDSEHDRIFVTGKLWPKMFEIQVVKQ